MTLISLWQDRHAHTEDTTPVPARADVVVIGAGITGLTTGLLLARAGRSVVVLEARHVGAGTTGGSTAKVSLLQGTRLSVIARRQPRQAVRRYVEANIEGQAWLARFCADHGVGVETRDAVTYAVTETGRRAARRELAAAQGAGLDVSWDDDLPLPFDTRGGVRLPGQLQVDPMEVLEALAAEARRHGAVVAQGRRVRSVRGHAPVRVQAEGGDLEAGAVVVATNMPILDRGMFFARMSPARSYGLAFRTPQAGVDAMYLSADAAPSRSLRDADGGTLMLVGGAGHITGRGGPPSRRLDELRRWTADYWPEAEETHAWSAQDFLPARELPYAGPVLPSVRDVFVAGGYAKWGMTNGVAAALSITAQITGGHMKWGEVLMPWTSRELSGAPAAASANLGVGLQLTRGWLRPLRPVQAGSPDGLAEVRYDGLGPPVARSAAAAGHELSAVCTHLGGVVSYNDAERSWDCPLHGSRFDADGDVLEGPATCGLRLRS